jgi:hypothetical protein
LPLTSNPDRLVYRSLCPHDFKRCATGGERQRQQMERLITPRARGRTTVWQFLSQKSRRVRQPPR